MAQGGTTKKRRQRGFIRQRGGSFQVLVFAGKDPISGKDSYLTGSASTAAEAEKLKTRLLSQTDTQRSAVARVSLGYALDSWMEMHEGEATTTDTYRGYIERVIRPALGDVAIAKLTPRMLEQLYADLRRCRTRCKGKPVVEHRVEGPHECREVVHRRRRAHDCESVGCRTVECSTHVCRPLSPATVRQIHSVISGALSSAMRWDWIASNPASIAKKPKQPRPQPKPPSPEQAARILAAAWEVDAAWGTLVWLVMVTGMRRGELAALRWSDVHLDAAIVEVRRSYTHRSGTGIEKDTKTHQMRRIALDVDSVELLAEHLFRVRNEVARLGIELPADAFVFSFQPDYGGPCHPDSISHRYVRMCKDVGIDTHLHALRHYSATELISAGVDVRTVAGRLGHGGGGTTTLRVYAAWVAESDKRAAELISGRMIRPSRGARPEP